MGVAITSIPTTSKAYPLTSTHPCNTRPLCSSELASCYLSVAGMRRSLHAHSTIYFKLAVSLTLFVVACSSGFTVEVVDATVNASYRAGQEAVIDAALKKVF